MSNLQAQNSLCSTAIFLKKVIKHTQNSVYIFHINYLRRSYLQVIFYYSYNTTQTELVVNERYQIVGSKAKGRVSKYWLRTCAC